MYTSLIQNEIKKLLGTQKRVVLYILRESCSTTCSPRNSWWNIVKRNIGSLSDGLRLDILNKILLKWHKLSFLIDNLKLRYNIVCYPMVIVLYCVVMLTLSARSPTFKEQASSTAPPPYTIRLSRTRFRTTHNAS